MTPLHLVQGVLNPPAPSRAAAGIGPPASLKFTVQPSTVVEDTVISPSIQVSILDAGQSVVPTANNTVNLSIFSGGPVVVGGTWSRAAVNGVATFNDLTIDRPATLVLFCGSTGLVGNTSAPLVVTVSSGFAAPDIASHDFQDGTVGAFNDPYGSPGITIINDPTGAGFGKVCKLLYHVEGAGNNDSNTSIDYNNSAASPNYAGKTDLYHRMYFYQVDPGTQGGHVVELIPSGLQRKLIYINAGEGSTFWTSTISRWLDGATGIMDDGVYGPRQLFKLPSPEFTETESCCAIDVLLNTWYYVELRVKLNTPGSSNGIVQVWMGIKGAVGLANALLYDVQNANVRGSHTTTYQSVRFGQQLDAFTNGTYVIDDTRYIKNVAISTQRIGP